MKFKHLKITYQQHSALVLIDRPKKLNALHRETLSEISQALEELIQEHRVRVILISGAGDKAFVAGADIAEFSDFNAAQGEELSKSGHEMVFDAIANCPKPIIAAINGYALGGGLELAMAAHIRIASDQAMMGLPEVSLGLIPGYGGTQRLPKLIGKGRALEMICTAGMIDAQKAAAWGLVNRVVPHATLVEVCLSLAAKIAQNSSSAIALAIDAVNASDTPEGFAVEIENFGRCFDTQDFTEGTQAFLHKKKPKFN